MTIEETSAALAEELAKPDVPKPKAPRPKPDCDLLLLDVAHLFWAAWHASADQEVGGAFSATLDRLHGTRRDVPHVYFAVCIDWPPYWRVERCSEYKAQRSYPSEFAVEQFRRVRERIRELGFLCWGKRGFEADDIIATAVRYARERGLTVTIATGDKDLMQLVDEAVRVFNTRTGETFGPAEVAEKHGVPPEKIRDLLTLTGDKSDNIPGVRGVGQKKAAALLTMFGSWRDAVAAANEFSLAIPIGLAQSLRDHGESEFELAWELVGLRDDAPIHFGALFGEPPQELEEKKCEIEQRKEPNTMTKMSLNNVSKGRKKEPFDVILYGPEGIGKSCFAAEAPVPVFFDLEHGTEELDVERMPSPDTWQEFRQGIQTLLREPHSYKTLVIDTADALETLIYAAVCKEHGEPSIESFGYGKGYDFALKLWQDFVADLRAVRARGMNTIILAHSQVKTFSNPRGADYDRFQLKLAKKTEGFLKDRTKALLFVTYNDAVKEKKSQRAKAFGDGSRVVYTAYRPAFDAKNRYGLPFEIGLSWAEFEAAAREGQPAPIADIRAELDAIMPTLEVEHQASLTAAIGRAGDDAHKLALLIDWARNKVSGKEAA